jgi:hypothetical protein
MADQSILFRTEISIEKNKTRNIYHLISTRIIKINAQHNVRKRAIQTRIYRHKIYLRSTKA